MENREWERATELKFGPTGALPRGLARKKEPPFPYQEQAIRKLAEWWRGPSRGGLLCLPTGAGKTRTTVDFVLEHVAAKKVRILWLTHRVELINQAVASFAARSHLARSSFYVGCFTGGRKTQEIVRVVVASIPTLVRGDNISKAWERQGGFDLVVVDECHHTAAKTWAKVLTDLMGRRQNLKVLGLSATPTRKRKAEKAFLWKIFDRPIHEEKPRTLIDEGYLAKPEILPLTTGLCFKNESRRARSYANLGGELPRSLLNEIAENELRNQFVAEEILRSGDTWGKTLVFTKTIRQAESLRERLRAASVYAGLITGDMTLAERACELRSFVSGRRKILVNVDVLTEGTDLPNVETVVLARPTRSQVLFQQMVGRGMRGPKVGGTRSCRIVVLQDEIQELVEHQLTHDYGWEVAQLKKMELWDVGAGAADEAAQSRHKANEDEHERALVRAAIEEFRSIFAVLDLGVPPDGSPLLGWWELPGQQVKTKGQSRARVIPHFEGDGELHAALGRLAEAMASGVPASRVVPRSQWVTRLTCLEFWKRAIDSRTAPTYSLVGENSADRCATLHVDLMATAAEEATHERRERAEARLRELIAGEERRRQKMLEARTADRLGDPRQRFLIHISRERDVCEELIASVPIHDQLRRLYEAAEALLGPHQVRLLRDEYRASEALRVFAQIVELMSRGERSAGGLG